MKRIFLMKATKIVSLDKIDSSWTWSVKLDGIRAFWDGGITRGRYDVPFAKGVRATGLWSTYGNVIHAPQWWLDALPRTPLDGELWLGPQRFNDISSIVRKHEPVDSEWQQIKLHVFDMPGLSDVYIPLPMTADPNQKVQACPDLFIYMQNRAIEADVPFTETKEWSEASRMIASTAVSTWVEQHYISSLDELLNKVLPQLLEQGHEGLVFRHRDALWEPVRSKYLLKLKPFLDAEAKVVGMVFGKDTDKGSRNRGKLGSLIVELPSGKRFNLSGFTDEERILPESARQYAWDHPDEEAPFTIQSEKFPLGTIVTFRYREMTPAGIPKEARYWRYAPSWKDLLV